MCVLWAYFECRPFWNWKKKEDGELGADKNKTDYGQSDDDEGYDNPISDKMNESIDKLEDKVEFEIIQV